MHVREWPRDVKSGVCVTITGNKNGLHHPCCQESWGLMILMTLLLQDGPLSPLPRPFAALFFPFSNPPISFSPLLHLLPLLAFLELTCYLSIYLPDSDPFLVTSFKWPLPLKDVDTSSFLLVSVQLFTISSWTKPCSLNLYPSSSRLHYSNDPRSCPFPFLPFSQAIQSAYECYSTQPRVK